jgi:hypothetical protein
MERLRSTSKSLAGKTGLLPAARALRRLVLAAINPAFRHQESERRRRERVQLARFLEFRGLYGSALQYNLSGAPAPAKRVLIIGAIRLLEVELALIKAMEMAGFEPVVLLMDDSPVLRRYYELAGVREFHLWSEYCRPDRFAQAADAVITQCGSFERLLEFEHAGARVGKIAASTTMRILTLATLDLAVDTVRATCAREIAVGMAAAEAARKVLETAKPELALSIETGYADKGALFDVCLANGVDVVRWHPAHKSNTLMLKRYSLATRGQHPHSLSSESWQLVRAIRWTDARRTQLHRELHGTYATGDWYGENATQFDRRLVDAVKIRQQLGLHPGRKTAFIFPHIFWDASFSWGDNLFHDYQAWFLRTVEAACDIDHVNWVIKIHPAHIGKAQDGVTNYGEPAEVTTLREAFGTLPDHIFQIAADSDISTYSLFDLMDYCVTVRGTVGLEAAARGIPVLTAGTGRYDHMAFTIDSESEAEYLARIAHIADIAPMSPAQRELAERYAYGLFILRPLPLTSVTLEFEKGNDPANYFARTRYRVASAGDWWSSADFGSFAKWLNEGGQPDFLMPVPANEGGSAA